VPQPYDVDLAHSTSIDMVATTTDDSVKWLATLYCPTRIRHRSPPL